MSEADIVSEGRAALARIKEHSRRLFEDYLAVGDALKIGQSECLKLAGSNSLHTPAYRKHWRRWLDENGFGKMEAGERMKTMWMAENKDEVIRWRDGLDEVSRRHANHPGVVIAHMKGGTQPAPRGPKSKERKAERELRELRELLEIAPFDAGLGGFSWPDECRRRVILALRNTRGQPLAVQADAALRAAIRCSADYRALKSQLTKAAPAAPREIQRELELHA